MRLSIKLDDNLHKKLKIIAVQTHKPLNTVTVEFYEDFVKNYELEHGEIKLLDE